MRRLQVLQRGELVGTLPVPDNFRLPMSDAEIAAVPAMFLARSRSWLYEVRPDDLKLDRRTNGAAEELVIIAASNIAPGDFGLMIGFEAAAGNEHYTADDGLVEFADEIRRMMEGQAHG